MDKLEPIIEQSHDLPVSRLGSNDPYSVGSDPSDSARREQVRDEFLVGDEQWPDVNLPMLKAEELLAAERQLQTLLKAVEAAPETVRRDAVYKEIAVKLVEVYRHLEVARGLGLAAARREVSRERAGNMTLEVFGEPDEATFNGLRLHEDAVVASIVSRVPALAAYADDYHALAGQPDAGTYSTERTGMDEATVLVLRSDLCEVFPGLQATMQQELPETVSAEDAVPYFDEMLTTLGLMKQGWRSRLSEGRAASTSAISKTIQIGRRRAPFTPSRLTAVAFHEAIHAYRAQRASEQVDPLKQRPLPGSLAFEEGLATSLEQVISGESRTVGQSYYISLGYQLGLDRPNRKRRTFRETHELLWRRALLLSGEEPSEDAIRQAKMNAYQTTIRTMRGNSLDARDLSYFEGSCRAVQWLNNIASLDHDERLKKLAWVLSGKFDPTNQTHAELFAGDVDQP